MTTLGSTLLAEWELALLQMQVDIYALASRHLEQEARDPEIAQEIIDRALVFDLIATNAQMPLSSDARRLMHKAYFDTAQQLHSIYGAEIEV